MIENLTTWLRAFDRFADIALATAALIFLGMLLNFHWLLITAPVPLDWYEGVMPLITGLLSQGENPYTLAHQPMHSNVYPPLYNLMVVPFTHWFDNNLILHRAVSGVCIVSAIVLCAHCTHRQNGKWIDALLVAIMIYAGLLYYSTPVASTNGTGVLFFLLSALLPWYRRFDTTGLALSIGFGLMGFFSKQYFAAGMVMVCAHLFVAVSMRTAAVYAATVLAVVATSLWWVHTSSPYYLDNVFFSTMGAARELRTPSHMVSQITAYSLLYTGPLILLILATVQIYRKGSVMPSGLNWQQFNRALLVNPPHYLWLCFAIATTLIVLVLGSNPGNWLSYLFQLMTPFLAIGLLCTVRSANTPRPAVAVLLLLFFYQSWQMLPRQLHPDTHNWDKLDTMVANHENMLVSPALISLLTDHHKEVFQDGHTFYFNFAASKPSLFKKEDESRSVAGIWQSYNRELYRRVQAGEFQLVLASHWDINGFFGANPPPHSTENGAELFRRHYKKTKTLPINLTDQRGGGIHKIGVWVPRAAPL